MTHRALLSIVTCESEQPYCEHIKPPPAAFVGRFPAHTHLTIPTTQGLIATTHTDQTHDIICPQRHCQRSHPDSISTTINPRHPDYFSEFKRHHLAEYRSHLNSLYAPSVSIPTALFRKSCFHPSSPEIGTNKAEESQYTSH